MNFKTFLNNVLNGLSIGIVVALIPGALLGELMKLINTPLANKVLMITSFSTTLLPVAIGLAIAMQFKFTPIQSASLTIATVIGSGVLAEVSGNAFLLKGTGDVINTALVGAIAALLVLMLGNSLKSYTILLVPMIVVVIAGGIGIFTLPYVKMITGYIGRLVLSFTTLQPYLMGALIAVSFALLIVSPISTVGIALAISISGIASGAANLGIVAAGFGLAISGRSINSFGTSIAHFLGSPKMQMANFIKKPVMIVPIVLNALVLGILAAFFNVQGTSMSAGFGISGLIGPINAYNTGSSILIISIIFVIVPVVLGFIFDYLCKKVFKIVQDKDYELSFK